MIKELDFRLEELKQSKHRNWTILGTMVAVMSVISFFLLRKKPAEKASKEVEIEKKALRVEKEILVNLKLKLQNMEKAIIAREKETRGDSGDDHSAEHAHHGGCSHGCAHDHEQEEEEESQKEKAGSHSSDPDQPKDRELTK